MATSREPSTLTISGGGVLAEIVPGRGGMVTRLRIGDDEVLYLDPETLDTPKVRGGIPVLFPNPGPLSGSRFEVSGRSYTLGQHGFARERSWEVVHVGPADAELRLESTPETLENFPFEFDIRLAYRCSGSGFSIVQTWRNPGQKNLPLHFGFHPYFSVADADKPEVKISTDAKRAWDNVLKTEIPFRGLDLTAPEVDLHLLDHTPKETILERPGRPPLRLSWEDPYHLLVVWTLRGKDFVCVEPWTARGNALNTGEGLIHIAPGERRSSFFAIAAV